MFLPLLRRGFAGALHASGGEISWPLSRAPAMRFGDEGWGSWEMVAEYTGYSALVVYSLNLTGVWAPEERFYVWCSFLGVPREGSRVNVPAFQL